MSAKKRPNGWKMPRETDLGDPAFRWRLILGPRSADASPAFGTGQPGSGGGAGGRKGRGGKPAPGGAPDNYTVADAIDNIFDLTAEDPAPGGTSGGKPGGKGAGSGKSAPYIPDLRGLMDDIRKFFPREVVTVIQKDLIERRGLRQLLFEPETLESLTPDMSLITLLLELRDQIPDGAKDTARRIVRTLVEEIERRLKGYLERILGRRPRKTGHRLIGDSRNIDWRRTIRTNLKNYDPGLEAIVPERVYFWETFRDIFKAWRLIIAVDQSGSMAESVVYSSVFASVFASLKSIKTHVLLFDTKVVDMSEYLSDPVELLFGAQLGGGTDIGAAVSHARTLMSNPEKTIFVLITDLCDGGDTERMLADLQWMADSRAKVMTILALSDTQLEPQWDHDIARRVRALDIPVFACTPEKLADLVVGVVMGQPLPESGKP